ncbi:LOW QUALITY PROTEIN: uncharacterized protein EMH_0091210 [Eimeria mitis]|uniref:Uncharacterized protein n=1 Tax=Eimeria mitis TaxID=44415 RepID=U6K972_9EIME|nr:LOW QUALITY PROTEIN: uncharacterized protein EMH_0091210 [Eimeria mitis]CDJ34580.1 hypothetical protein, conserved [Eimeria mitis]
MQQLGVLRECTDLREAKAAAEAAEEAADHLSIALREFVDDIRAAFTGEEEQKLAEAVQQQLIAKPVQQLLPIDQQPEHVTEQSKGFSAAAEDTAQHVEEVAVRCELQLVRCELQLVSLEGSRWVSAALLKRNKEKLKELMAATEAERGKVENLLDDMHSQGVQQQGFEGVLEAIDTAAAAAGKLAERRTAAWQLQVEVEMLVMLQQLATEAEKVSEAALEKVVGTSILQAADLKNIQTQEDRQSAAAEDAKAAETLRAAAAAVDAFVSSSVFIHQGVRHAVLEDLLQKDAIAAAAPSPEIGDAAIAAADAETAKTEEAKREAQRRVDSLVEVAAAIMEGMMKQKEKMKQQKHKKKMMLQQQQHKKQMMLQQQQHKKQMMLQQHKK